MFSWSGVTVLTRLVNDKLPSACLREPSLSRVVFSIWRARPRSFLFD